MLFNTDQTEGVIGVKNTLIEDINHRLNDGLSSLDLRQTVLLNKTLVRLRQANNCNPTIADDGDSNNEDMCGETCGMNFITLIEFT